MNNNQSPLSPDLQDWIKVLGGILAVIAGLFGVVQLVTQQPGVALLIAVIGALLLSAYFIKQRHIIETAIAWLAAIVIGLAIYVLVPRAGTVTGIVFDASDNPLLNELVILKQENGEERRARTDTNGRYEFKDVPVGHFDISVGDIRNGGEIKSLLSPRLDIDLHLIAPVASLQLTDTPSPTFTNTPEPTETHTPQPEDTPTPQPTITVTLSPPPCPLLEIYPQASSCEAFFVFSNEGGTLEDDFLSTGSCVHSGSFGLGLSYSNSGPANSGWGVQWLDGPDGHLDASGYSHLRFWVKGESGNETFQVGIKDTSGNEIKIESRILTVTSTRWTQVSVDFSAYADENSLSSLENVNFGFNETHGSGSICIDDLEFIP
jgi:Carboxypeptidase regulatory-like domain/Carbohydrate binding domain (family 11)